VREDLLREIQEAVRSGAFRFSEHALMEAAEDRVAISDIQGAILGPDAEVIEDYPEDARGPSLLILGWLAGRRPVHAVLSYPPNVVVITVYRPDERWENYRKRR